MKIECEVCHDIGYLQQLGNYYRIRHYQGIDKTAGKSKFYYHPQSKQYILSILRETDKAENFIVKDVMVKCSSGLDQKLQDLTSKSSGRSLVWLGHQPPTLTTRVQIPATASKNVQS